MAFFNDNFHGFIGSKEYDKYLDTLDFSDEDTSYVGLLKEEAEEKKAQLRDFVKDVGDADVVVFPDYKLVVFDAVQKGMFFSGILSLQMFPDGTWNQRFLSADQFSVFLCNEGREDSYDPETGHLAEFLDKLEDLGLPVSNEKNGFRISSFATFADASPDYIKAMKTSGQVELLNRRNDARQGYEAVVNNLASGSVVPVRPSRRQAQPRRPLSPDAKARYYARMAEKETVDFVKDRYAEKSEYWDKVSRGEEVSLEMEASCGPDHKWNAADNYVSVRHKLEGAQKKNLGFETVDILEKRLKYWEQAAREEKKVNDFVRGLGKLSDSVQEMEPGLSSDFYR